MTARPKSRILAASALSLLLAFEGHRLDIWRHGMGKEAFLAKQAADFDKHYAASRPSAHLSAVGFWMGLSILGVYELLTLGICAVIRSRVRNPDLHDAGV